MIGNPPYGDRKNNLYVKFYKKAIKECDYITFILPAQQYNNDSVLYEFNLIYSEDLGKRKYTDRELHCCFNIYQRNIEGLNKKPKHKLKDVVLTEHHRTRKPLLNNNYDLRICAFGSSIGKICEYPNRYCREICFTISNEKYKQRIIDLIINTDFKKNFPTISANCIEIGRLYKYIKEQIPEIE